jgi:ubiquinone/menaquinone biosynthesis C-methylase UbiE
MSIAPLREIVDYYTRFAEESRLETGSAQLEFERTKELILRFIPPPPAQIVDVGGASGSYAFWLASLGYSVHLIDATPRLVEDATRRNVSAECQLASVAVGDARQLPRPAASADVVLLLGPLYHLTERPDRITAIREAQRVLRKSGTLIVAGISRYAATLDGLAFHPALSPQLATMRHRSLADGQYRNETSSERYFTTAYFHRAEDLADELREIGCRGVRVFGIEGPGWLLPDFQARWNDDTLRAEILTVARLLEEETSIMGASGHLLAVGTLESP